MYSKLARYILGPIYDILTGHHFTKYLGELERTQWMSPDEIKHLQEERLGVLLRHAYQNVPYYHKVFEQRGLTPQDIKAATDLEKLPILTKEDIRNNLEDLVARNYNRKQLILSSTGGSMGEPLKFYIIKESMDRGGAAAYRAYKAYRFTMGDKHVLLWGHPAGLPHRLRTRIEDRFKRRIYLDAFRISEADMELFVRKLRTLKPKAIICYASAGYLLARYLEERKIQGIRVSSVFSTAEKLYDHQRQTIERAFNCEVFDFYGGRETQSIAFECPEHHGYHVTAENVVLEFIRDGKQVGPGQLGKVTVTDLNNYGMPFIRYENGDMGVPSDQVCPCGRGLPLIKSIEGRITDVFVTSDGAFIPALVLIHLVFKDLNSVKQYQVIQKTRTKTRIKIVKDERYYDEKDTEYILEHMHKYLGKGVEITIEFVDSIPSLTSGKQRVFISEVPHEFK